MAIGPRQPTTKMTRPKQKSSSANIRYIVGVMVRVHMKAKTATNQDQATRRKQPPATRRAEAHAPPNQQQIVNDGLGQMVAMNKLITRKCFVI